MKTNSFPGLIFIISITLIIANMILLFLVFHFTGDHYSYSGTIIYPIFLHFVSPWFPALEIALAFLGAAGLIVIINLSSINKWVRYFSLLLLFLPIGVILWGIALSFVGRYPQPIHLSSIQFSDHIYNLIADPCYQIDSVCPPTSYIVLRCDNLGLVCQFWTVPKSETEYGKIATEAKLIVDLYNHTLYAQIDNQKFQVVDGISQ